MIRTAVCLVAAVLLLSSVAAAQATEPSLSLPWNQSRKYVATTTLMDSLALSDTSTAETRSARLAIAVSIAGSNRVMRDVAATLEDLGLSYSPGELIRAARVYETGTPGTLAIAVYLDDAAQAKVAADVIAAELKKVYGEIELAAQRQTREFLQDQVQALREQMKQAYAALDKQKKRVKVFSAEDPELAVLQADAQIARDNYTAAAARLFDANLDEQLARCQTALMTIDAAYVAPADGGNASHGMGAW